MFWKMRGQPNLHVICPFELQPEGANSISKR
jgi:hypothetical protein